VGRWSGRPRSICRARFDRCPCRLRTPPDGREWPAYQGRRHGRRSRGGGDSERRSGGGHRRARTGRRATSDDGQASGQGEHRPAHDTVVAGANTRYAGLARVTRLRRRPGVVSIGARSGRRLIAALEAVAATGVVNEKWTEADEVLLLAPVRLDLTGVTLGHGSRWDGMEPGRARMSRSPDVLPSLATPSLTGQFM
jgi:hypothetical protein